MKGHITCLFLIFCAMAAISFSALAQTATDRNEGTRVEQDTANQMWRLKWWSREGRTYLLQHSEDLSLWTWMDVIVTGNDSVRDVGFHTNADKFFMRLVHTDQPSADPANEDWDGDGVSNFEELHNQTDPFSNKDTDGDGVSDDKETADGTDPNDFFNSQPPVLRIHEGNNQGDLSGSTLLKPLTVRLTNKSGVPALNREIAFEIAQGEGILTIINSGQTDAQGLASATLSLISAPWEGILVQATYESQSVVFTATVGNPNYAPKAPGRPTIQQNPGEATALVEWEDRSNNEVGFHIERSTNNQTWTRIATLPVNATTFSDSGLTPDRPHSYRIVAFNDAP